MRFIAASLVLQAATQLSHFLSIGNHSISQHFPVSDGVELHTFHDESYSLSSDLDSIKTVCYGKGSTDAAGAFTRFYRDHTMRYIATSHSCVLFDSTRQTALLSSDTSGLFPLWFNIQRTEDKSAQAVAVSDDLMVIQFVTNQYVSAVPAGRIITIDLNTLEIIKTEVKATASQSTNPDIRRKLLGAFKSFVRTNQQLLSSSEVIVETDGFRASSRLLACLLRQLNVSFTSIFAVPDYLIADPALYVDDTRFHSLLAEYIPSTSWSEYSPSHQQLALQSRRVCNHGEDGSQKRVYISHHTFLDVEPEVVYFREKLCDLYNTTILYPFAPRMNSIFQRWSLGQFNEFVDSLSFDGFCFNNDGDLSHVRSVDVFSPSPISHFSDLPDERDSQSSVFASEREKNPPSMQSETSWITDVLHTADQHVSPSTNPQHEHRNKQPPRYIFLVLATRDYFAMLHNFFCYVRSSSLYPEASFPLLPIVVLTNDASIQQLAQSFGAGVVSTPAFLLQELRQAMGQTATSMDGASFGSVAYQALILSRTFTANVLLEANFSPIIADIDTVWLRNPLLTLPAVDDLNTTDSDAFPYDVAIVDDGGEVCGCFVVLQPTGSAKLFWSTVLQDHRDLVKTAIHSGNLVKFDESEQKILTRFIYGRQYQRSRLRVHLLPSEAFPNGVEFFNQWTNRVNSTTSSGVSFVVHNNFLIGRQCKYTRFEEYGLWQYRPPFPRIDFDNDSSIYSHYGLQYCQTHSSAASTIASSFTTSTAPFEHLRSMFHYVSKEVYRPSIDITLPIHNTIMVEGDRLPILIHSSGIDIDTTQTTPEQGLTYMVNTQPAQVSYVRHFNLMEITIPRNEQIDGMNSDTSHVFTSTFFAPHSNLDVTVDVALARRRHWAVDVGDNYTIVRRAHEQIVHTYSQPAFWDEKHLEDRASEDAYCEVGGECDRHRTKQIEGSEEPSAPCLALQYRIKVITMNRLGSLQRLLSSLVLADYDHLEDIELEILVDGGRNDKEKRDVQAVITFLESFHWPHGRKTITVRPHNIGLAAQWFEAWVPKSLDEVAFIFEDDLEVSPHYFQWASRAANKYYACNHRQRHKQEQLLEALVTRLLHPNFTADDMDFHDLAYDLAGFPLMYGICLQRQHLAPNHPQHGFEVRNGYRPFLYSLVGSWGPLVFPAPWSAFRLWWRKHQEISLLKGNNAAGFSLPMTSSLIVNAYALRNPRIWTPYLVRFAYELGAKCLYPNLPGNLTMVNNHRLEGENYGQTLGEYARLLSREHVSAALEDGEASRVHRAAWEARHALSLPALQAALSYFPRMQELSRWQIDFNQRRSGVLGSQGTLHMDDTFLRTHLQTVAQALAWHRQFYEADSIGRQHNVPWFSTELLIETQQLLEGVLLPQMRVVFLEFHPLLPVLLSLPAFQATVTVYTTHSTLCTAPALKELHGHERVRCVFIGDITTLSTVAREEDGPVDLLMLYPALLHPTYASKVRVLISQLSSPQNAQYHELRHVMIFDLCHAAPSLLTIQPRNQPAGGLMMEYSAIETICDSQPLDHGTVLYQLRSKLPGSVRGEEMVGLGRRLSETISTKRFVHVYDNIVL